jgi:hypothetical protein
LRHSVIAYELAEKIGEEISSWVDDTIRDTQIRKIAEAMYFITVP